METKHTKGEWEVTNQYPNGLSSLAEHIEIKSEQWSIAAVFTDGESKEEAEANAKLIAAAPELLEALICMMKANPMFVDICIINKCNNAIKKATE